MARSDIFGRLFRLGTVAVSGDSMLPTFGSGDWLVVRWKSRFKVGDVVVIEREEWPGVLLIKRFLRMEADRVWVEGDSQSSKDSRHWGAISADEIVGKVLYRIRKSRDT